jgi:hypothetical protein
LAKKKFEDLLNSSLEDIRFKLHDEGREMERFDVPIEYRNNCDMRRQSVQPEMRWFKVDAIICNIA